MKKTISIVALTCLVLGIAAIPIFTNELTPGPFEQDIQNNMYYTA